MHCLHIADGCEWEGKISDQEVSQPSAHGWTIVFIKNLSKFITEIGVVVVRYFELNLPNSPESTNTG